MQTLDIISRHKTLAEAVAASGLDLSYNPQEAARRIASTDQRVKEAFVAAEGVFFIYWAPDDLQLFHKFDPFVSCLDNRLFAPVTIVSGHGAYEVALITIGEPCFQRNSTARRTLARMGTVVH